MKTKAPKVNNSKGGTAVPASLLIVALLVLGTVAYWNSFAVPLVFDDFLTIQKNTGVQFGDYLTPEILGTRPLLYLTFALNFLVHGQDVWGYHLVNLALHLGNGILVFFIVANLFGRVIPARPLSYAFLAAAFFVLHPIQTESVTYISSRSELLSALFFNLSVLLFVRRRPEGIGFLWSLVAAVPFLLGLFSKETVITLPAILLLIDFLFLSSGEVRAVVKRWAFYSTFVVGGVVASYLLLTRVLVESIGEAVPGQLSRFQYLWTEARAVTTYLRFVVLPVNLNLDHDFRPSLTLLEPSVILALLFIGSLLIGCYRFRKREPLLSLGVLWFLITLSPTSSIVPIPDTLVEHRLYLPMVGLCVAFPILLEWILRRFKHYLAVSTVPVGLAIVTVLMVGTILRNQVWADEVTLWKDVVAKSPAKARAYNSLAIAYSKRADYDNSIATLNRGLERVSGAVERRAFVEALGNMYLQLRRFPEAIDAFEKTTQVADKKASAFAYNNLGVAYLRLLQDLEGRRSQLGDAQFQIQREGALDKSETALSRSMELDPTFFWPYDSYISVLFERGKADAFNSGLQASISQKPDARAFYGLGKIAMLGGDFATAAGYLEKATELNAAEKVPFLHLGFSLSQLSRLDEAVQSYIRAIRIDPQFIDARQNLGLVYIQQKQYSKALESFQEVLRVDPNHVPTHLEMAKILIEQGDRRQAREHLSIVLGMEPQNELARQLLQMIGS